MTQQKSQRILVTGGAGFLGSHLVDRLIQEGHTVTCLDLLSTGSMENIAHLLPHPRFAFCKRDVCDPIEMAVDLIFNLACPASPPHYQADPIHTIRTSVWGAYNLLELAKQNRCPIFQASTSEVYGDPEVHPQPESYWGHVNPIGPRACYDEGKRLAETLLFEYHRLHGVPIHVGRIFNTYGPRMDPNDGRVVSNLIVQALRNEPLTIYGDGTQTRSFCYVDDLIEAILRFVRSPHTGPMNLGNPEEYTMLELARLVRELTGTASEIAFAPLPKDDPKQRRPVIAQAHQLLKWQPRVPVREGLTRTIAYFQSRLCKAALHLS